MAKTDYLFTVNDLVVKYHKMIAISVSHLSVPHGKILIIGPNGSGKTTFIKVLLGFMRPSRGTVSLYGIDPFENPQEIARYVTYVRDVDEIPDNLKLQTLIDILRERFGDENVDEAVERLGLSAYIHKRLSELSRGTRRKASLLVALASNKRLIVIDEPFSGLDSTSRAIVSEMLDKKEVDMIIISHIQPKVRFDHLIVIESAQVTYSGSYKYISWYSSY